MNCGTNKKKTKKKTFQAGNVNLYLEYVSISMRMNPSSLHNRRDLV